MICATNCSGLCRRVFPASCVLAMMHFYGCGRSLVLARATMRSLITLHAQPLAPLKRPGPCIPLLSFLFACSCFRPMAIGAQCAGIASSPSAAADCAAHAIPVNTVAKLDHAHPYTLAELIDIPQHNAHRT